MPRKPTIWLKSATADISSWDDVGEPVVLESWELTGDSLAYLRGLLIPRDVIGLDPDDLRALGPGFEVRIPGLDLDRIEDHPSADPLEGP